MKVKMILPALTEANSPYFRPIKYSLFPPLGLLSLAGYLSEDDEITIQDEHVEVLDISDNPDIVIIQVYITSAYRAYELADHYRKTGAYVCLGGIHVTTLPGEAMIHADSIFLGPGEDIWPMFLEDYRKGEPKKVYFSRERSLKNLPRPRRDLMKSHLYLVPNSLVVSRGCPHSCDFCYKESFFRGGKSFYTGTIDDALSEIQDLPGRHLYFLDDNLLGLNSFAGELFDGMAGMGRLWQAAGTVQSVLQPGVLEKAARSGLRSLFVGFESLDPENLKVQNKRHNLYKDYSKAINRLHDHGVMVNASFVFGMDEDDPSVFERTVEWAIQQGIETATFHILTPYPGTALYKRMTLENRITTYDWDMYDTRHAVFQPERMSCDQLEAGYNKAYQLFYSWGSIFKSAFAQPAIKERVRHLAYTGGWKKFEPFWDMVIRHKELRLLLPFLETVLSGFTTHSGQELVGALTAHPHSPVENSLLL